MTDFMQKVSAVAQRLAEAEGKRWTFMSGDEKAVYLVRAALMLDRATEQESRH